MCTCSTVLFFQPAFGRTWCFPLSLFHALSRSTSRSQNDPTYPCSTVALLPRKGRSSSLSLSLPPLPLLLSTCCPPMSHSGKKSARVTHAEGAFEIRTIPPLINNIHFYPYLLGGKMDFLLPLSLCLELEAQGCQIGLLKTVFCFLYYTSKYKLWQNIHPTRHSSIPFILSVDIWHTWELA